MASNGQDLSVKMDGYTRFCLTVIAALLTVLIIGLWTDAVQTLDDAQAAEAFVDSSAQRKALIDAQQQTNAKLDQLISLFRTGQAKIQFAEGPAKKETNQQGQKNAAENPRP